MSFLIQTEGGNYFLVNAPTKREASRYGYVLRAVFETLPSNKLSSCLIKEVRLNKKGEDRHRLLHKHLDELLAMFEDTGKLPSQATIMELIEWSYVQAVKKRD